ncbi:LysR family transcriptional regulator [Halalkalibacter nanhaiisediminis]|uniref:DNA-binding transcriptional LysR family regulator n=1 Tax=Halalkalibacter nanhaiisediminis TaxID=688079 RepID=A0A562QB66_9BACI|nr:LysR family transcriptional regulator [Halalkalibacter nanhaiisediminis]TWI53982.1 DNA-binding transcriptional LysR family regulator [Halalkalibacter nanhaiisediminis]
MHIEQLKYILEVAKKGTISKAAETLHVSHSAISQAISNLESELGIPIFKRSRSGSVCTEEGKTVLKLSYDIMNKITELKEFGQKSSLMKGNLSMSSSPIFFSTVLPEALYAFKNDYPNIQIEINEDSTESIIAAVKNYQIDLGLIFGSHETLKSVSQHLISRSLYQPKFMVSVSKHSPLASKEVIYPEEMLQYPLVIRNEKFAKEVWENIFSTYGKGNILFYSNNDDVIKNVVAKNLAIGFSTDLMKYDPLVKNGEIIMIPYVDNKNKPILHLICIQAKNKYLSAIEKEFVNCITMKINSY